MRIAIAATHPAELLVPHILGVFQDHRNELALLVADSRPGLRPARHHRPAGHRPARRSAGHHRSTLARRRALIHLLQQRQRIAP